MIGPYKLLQKIGEGGSAPVYMAEQQRPIRRMVAVKIIKPGMDSGEVIARFESERQALAMMDHPNIAKVLDAGATESGRPYFVMELVKGIPITEFCDRNKMLAEQRLKLFTDVCSAIQHAHHKGVIHRDIKPSNVLVTLHDGVPVAKVIDFGIAKATLQKLTERTLFTAFGQMIGTPAYMSPEQAEMSGLDIDTRSDIYSLGVLLYELLTGTTPLESRRLREVGYAEIQRLIREEEPPRPSNRISSLGEAATVLASNRGMDARHLTQLLSGDMDWIVMKCLEKDRARRYASPDALAEDIGRYFKSESITARPPSAGYRFRRFARRNRGILVTAATMATALIVGTVVAVWQAVLARRSAAAERIAKETAQTREAEMEAVLDFVERRIFSAARPKAQEGGMGYDVKLADALLAAMPSLESGFRDQPLVEARLRTTLGESFIFLGDLRMATGQFDRARSLRLQHLGPDHPDTLNSMEKLASSYADAGRQAEELKLREEVFALKKARLGPVHHDTLMSLSFLASTYGVAGRRAEALRLREEALALTKARLGPDHPDTLMIMDDLAMSYDLAGREAEALKLREAALASVLKDRLDSGEDVIVSSEELTAWGLGLGEEFTAWRLGHLASRYADLGQHGEALRLHERALAMMKAERGPDDENTLEIMDDLASSYAPPRGDEAEAARLREEALALTKAKLGPHHPDTLDSMEKLASSYADAGRGPRQPKLREEALASINVKLGPVDFDTLRKNASPALPLRRRWAPCRGVEAPRGKSSLIQGEARAPPPRHAKEYELAGFQLRRRGAAGRSAEAPRGGTGVDEGEARARPPRHAGNHGRSRFQLRPRGAAARGAEAPRGGTGVDESEARAPSPRYPRQAEQTRLAPCEHRRREAPRRLTSAGTRGGSREVGEAT
ncbi:MAG: tetratricopeptide repeat protein [Isosphaeraceae bacterium]